MFHSHFSSVKKAIEPSKDPSDVIQEIAFSISLKHVIWRISNCCCICTTFDVEIDIRVEKKIDVSEGATNDEY